MEMVINAASLTLTLNQLPNDKGSEMIFTRIPRMSMVFDPAALVQAVKVRNQCLLPHFYTLVETAPRTSLAEARSSYPREVVATLNRDR